MSEVLDINEYVDDKQHGMGIRVYKNGSKYIGEFTDDVATGFGMFFTADGEKYVGRVVRDLPTGEGEWFDEDDRPIERGTGVKVSLSSEDEGTIDYVNGDHYKGAILDGKPHGQGEFVHYNGTTLWGTFVNGEQIDKADLDYDDVIEIGETVMVILDTDSWNRGEGLTRLRNPVKAQELIQKINGNSVPVSGLESRVAGGSAQAATEAGQVLEESLLVDLVLKELAGALLKEKPRHRDAVHSVAQQMLSEDWGEKDLGGARARAGELLAAVEDGEVSAPDAGTGSDGGEASEGE